MIHASNNPFSCTPAVVVDATELEVVDVTASREFTNDDSGKLLLVKNSGVVLTMLEVGMLPNFNCCIKALAGFDGSMDFLTNPVDNPNGLLLVENEMVSIARSPSTYIVSP